MRRLAKVVVAVLLMGGYAHAAGPAGPSGGKGGAASGSTSSGSGGATTGPQDPVLEVRKDQEDADSNLFASKKWWVLTAGWETHAMLWQNNLNGQGANRIFNYGSLSADANFLKYNRISVNFGFYERFLADSGETPAGVRLDDVTVVYNRTIPLPEHFTLQPRLTLALPTSYEAGKIGLIIAPTVSLTTTWRPVRGLSLDLRAFATWYFDRYAEALGGAQNAKGRLGGTLTVEYDLPFRNPKWLRRTLAVGVSVYTAWYAYYNIGTGTSPDITVPGATSDSTYKGQPPQQRYGGELYVRYTFPTFYGFKTDLRIALADGDSALGYNSLIHDGVDYLYLGYYETAEVYAALSIRY